MLLKASWPDATLDSLHKQCRNTMGLFSVPTSWRQLASSSASVRISRWLQSMLYLEPSLPQRFSQLHQLLGQREHADRQLIQQCPFLLLSVKVGITVTVAPFFAPTPGQNSLIAK